MARIHCLQHVESFSASTLSDDDAFWTHSQCITYEVCRRDGSRSFNIGWPSLEANDVFLLELEFRSVLNGHDALVVLNEATQRI